jgi:hypothetical protein
MSAACDRFIAALEAADCRQGRTWLCPAHDDRNASLSVSEGDDGRVLVKCFAGCKPEEIVGALGLEMRDLFDHDGHLGGEGSLPAQSRVHGCTLADYARAKRLPEDFLSDLGISDYKDSRFGAKILRIPYRDADGVEAAVRLRRALDKGDRGDSRFLWRKGSKPFLYGVWRIGQAREAGHVVIVEGESDAQTLWQHDIPAVGLPGAANWREDRDRRHLEGIDRVYVLIEPDRGGEAVLGWLGQSSIRDRAWLLQLDGHRDASSLHVADPATFAVRFEAAMEKAEPWRSVAAELETAERREAWEMCQELARHDDILTEFIADLRRCGVTGESQFAQIIFLVAVTRLFNRISSVAAKGPSAVGKSHVVEQTLRFFPESAFFAMTGMSEHALIYDEEPLAHRIMVIYEATGMESDKLSYIVRSLLSEGKLRYPTVTKDGGELKTIWIVREGPTGLITTTTAVHLHQETRRGSSALAPRIAPIRPRPCSSSSPTRTVSPWTSNGGTRCSDGSRSGMPR